MERIKYRLIGDDQRSCVFSSLFFIFFFLVSIDYIYTQGVFEGKRAGVVAGIGDDKDRLSRVCRIRDVTLVVSQKGAAQAV